MRRAAAVRFLDGRPLLAAYPPTRTACWRRKSRSQLGVSRPDRAESATYASVRGAVAVCRGLDTWSQPYGVRVVITVADDRESDPSPRYVFAHWYMRDAVFKIGVWSVLFAPGGAEYLRGMWDRCAQNLAENERVSPEGLDLCPVRHRAEWLILPIVFPPPVELTEAYFGAIAVRPGRRKWFFKKENPVVRYLLLERGVTGPDLRTLRTVVGEWTLTAHLNYGDGPRPLLPDFMDRVAGLLAGKGFPDAV